MTLHRAIRRFVCHLMVGALLFAQMAVAAYACSGAAASPTTQATGAAAMGDDAVDMMDMSHCDQMDSSAKALCAEHCHGGQQSSDTASPPAVSATQPLLLYVLPSQPVMQGAALPTTTTVDDALAVPPPPHAILHCVLRI